MHPRENAGLIGLASARESRYVLPFAMAQNPKARKTAVGTAAAPCIQLRGARQNNLKGFDLDLPLNRLIVVTGPSGSGKSSLAFDTLYAEGQRRYVETFSPYTRQFLDRMDKPAVDQILGIPPAIAIEQANHVKSSRSTVGTLTEINDYLKLLFPRLAGAFCPECARAVRPETPASIVAAALASLSGRTLLATFTVSAPPTADPARFFEFLRQQGYLRIWLEGSVHRTDEHPSVHRLPPSVRVIQDRIPIGDTNRGRVGEAVEQALNFGKDRMAFVDPVSGEEYPFSTGWHCAHCDRDLRPPTPGLFSFNHPLGACPSCRGFGRVIGIDLDRALPDKSLSIRGGVVKPFQSGQSAECQRDLLKAAAKKGVPVDIPFERLPARDQQWVLIGERGEVDATADELWAAGGWYGVKGYFDWLEARTYKMHVRVLLSRYRSYTRCAACAGGRYQPETLNFRITGPDGSPYTLPDLAGMPVDRLAALSATLAPPDADPTTAMLLNEITARLGYLVEVGLGYLSLDRATRSLSGGEIERVNLTSCLGASLVNSLFVLDEPSVGLHPRDTDRLIRVMQRLRDKGNTLVVVEHEESVIRAADHLIDLGPGRGESGGELVYAGPVEGIGAAKRSLTAGYLGGRLSIPVPARRREGRRFLKVRGAAQNNLKGIDVKIPARVFTCITGVSGSGKSTLVHDVIHANLMRRRGEGGDLEPGRCRGIEGDQQFDRVVMVDQSPLSRTPRSTPAVYTGVFEGVRELFAGLPDARAQGLTPGSFSFNAGAGRCERCSGTGFEKVEMQFLSDLYVRCPECEGKRYRPHILRVKLEGHSIHDVLELTASAAIPFLGRHAPALVGPLQTLVEVGLGYLRLGQPLNTLSGGESQRLKLVGQLAESAGEKSLLLFDEPTTGLHFDDVAQLLRVFDRLVEQGHTLVVIEHNIEVVKCADHVIDLGPEAGADGGAVVAAGTPEEVAECEASHTGRYLRRVLGGAGRVAEAPPAPRLPPAIPPGAMRVIGAREHNLRNLSVEIPRDELVVVTGLSGSGKSTLAFDILFNEGQRRFLDSMSPYARQFVEQMEKPDVDLIEGLPPTVAIEQRITRGGGKSTVATVTEVYHFLRLLFAKLGTQHCPKCKVPVVKQGAASIARRLESLGRKSRVRVLAPLVKARKGFHTDVARWADQHGFETMLVDGTLMPVKGFEKLERFKEHTIDVVVGELGPKTGGDALRIVSRALEVGKGTARLLEANGHLSVLSTERSCPECATAFEELDPRLFSFHSPHGWCPHCRGFGETWDYTPGTGDAESELERELQEERALEAREEGESRPCPECHGLRINAIARAVHVGDRPIGDFVRNPVAAARTFVGSLKFRGRDALIARDIVPEIRQRLQFMEKVGLGYLTLDRAAKTLSGGESQRIRLAAQLGSNLRGVLYVLDEPTIGLHARDNLALLDTLQALKRKGNSLVVVEHDEETMRRADRILDLGPGAGIHGGRLIAQGTMDEILAHPDSVTGRCLREPAHHPVRGTRRSLDDAPGWITITGATAHNLRSVDVRFPVARLTVITGVSGSGKSSLMRGSLMPALQERRKGGRRPAEQPWRAVTGREHLETVYEVDQSPIGKTSRSTPATYVKVFDEIRKLYAQLPVARVRGYTASRFSFNTEGGRCESCLGQGVIKLEMAFLPPSYLPCSECKGSRYNPQTLEVQFNGKSIGDVMDLTIEQAAAFFRSQPPIHRPLALLAETGLGYLKLGQPSPTLSGGEAQRIKLVSQLRRGVMRNEKDRIRRNRQPKSTLYLLEEPTIGLHMADVSRLVEVLHRLVDEGNTVIVIEHNVSVAAEADYIVDIGPEAGAEGGLLVACGPPELIARHKVSRIAPFLRETLRPGIEAKRRTK
jgi:excinuclease ABC subunit A